MITSSVYKKLVIASIEVNCKNYALFKNNAKKEKNQKEVNLGYYNKFNL
jgi:hypothetical protein